jgi:hypothetical protein
MMEWGGGGAVNTKVVKAKMVIVERGFGNEIKL